MSRLLYLSSVALMVIGGVLVVLALLQDFGAFNIFDDPPYLVGAACGAAGAVMMAGYRAQWQNDRRSEPNRTEKGQP